MSDFIRKSTHSPTTRFMRSIIEQSRRMELADDEDENTIDDKPNEIRSASINGSALRPRYA